MSVADDIDAVADYLLGPAPESEGAEYVQDLWKQMAIAADRLRRIAAPVRGEGAPTRKGGDGTAAPSSPSPHPTT